MKIRTAIFGTLAGAAALMTFAGPASAYVACNREGDCWHTENRVAAPGVVLQYHPDDWYFHRHWDGGDHMRWRDYHEGRGYWRNGIWITL